MDDAVSSARTNDPAVSSRAILLLATSLRHSLPGNDSMHCTAGRLAEKLEGIRDSSFCQCSSLMIRVEWFVGGCSRIFASFDGPVARGNRRHRSASWRRSKSSERWND